MFCECEQIEHSFKEKPFPVPGGYKQNTTYECMCGQRWWCHNDYFCLWSKINRNDEFTWQNVQRGCKVPVGIGNTSNTMDSEDVCVLPQTEFSDYEKEVPFPILSMKKILEQKTFVVQWTGDYRQNILSLQFYFPICIDFKDHSDWESKLSDFRVIYIGEPTRWPFEEQKEQIISKFSDSDSIIYLMCPSIKLDDDCKILGLLTKVVLLGDSNVGVIRPASFYNESGHREVIWKMKGL